MVGKKIRGLAVAAAMAAGLIVAPAAAAQAAPDCASGYACVWGDRYWLTAGSQSARVSFYNSVGNYGAYNYSGTSRDADQDITSLWNAGTETVYFYTGYSSTGSVLSVAPNDGYNQLNTQKPTFDNQISSGTYY